MEDLLFFFFFKKKKASVDSIYSFLTNFSSLQWI